jgi:hypothetical protein
VVDVIKETYDTLPTSETFPNAFGAPVHTMPSKVRCSKFSPNCGIRDTRISCWCCPTAAVPTFPWLGLTL